MDFRRAYYLTSLYLIEHKGSPGVVNRVVLIAFSAVLTAREIEGIFTSSASSYKLLVDRKKVTRDIDSG